MIPRLFTSSPAVLHQAHVLWPWFVVMLPAAGIVFGLDGVLIGAGDVAFLRTITIVAALGGFVPMTLAAARLGLGHRRGLGRADGVHHGAAGRDGLAGADRPLGGPRLG